MADTHTPPPTNYGDPFADRPPQLHFEEPLLRPFHSTDTLRPIPSSTSLSLDNYEDDEYVEKQPLNAGESFAGGFYPPGCVHLLKSLRVTLTMRAHRPLDPNTLGDPYSISRPESVLSTSTTGVESAWRRRQTIKRGVTRKVKLTQGNFISEYPVPTPVYSAIEEKWSATKTTEFSSAFLPFILFWLLNYGQPYAVYCGDL
jgi:chitin synthase